MQSGASTPRADGRPRRSSPSFSLTRGGPSRVFLSRYRSDSGRSILDRCGRRGRGGGAVERGARGPGPRPGHDGSPSAVTGGSMPSLEHASPAGRNRRRTRPGRPGAPATVPGLHELCRGADTCCMVPVHIVIVGCGRVGSGLGIELAGQGHSVAIIDRNAKAFRRLPDDWAGTTVVGSGFDRDDLDAARAPRRRRPRRRDQRGQLQHPDRPHRPRDLRHPQRGGPDLRPPAGPDLPPARHLHGGHRVVDDRPGAPPAPAQRAGERVVRPHRGDLPDRAPPARAVGRQAPGRPDACPARSPWWRSPGPAWSASTSPTWSARRATCSTSW